MSAEKDKSFSQVHDCSDHDAIHLTLDCPTRKLKPVIENFRSFGSADFDGINEYMINNPFEPTCFSNINNMVDELYEYFENMINVYVPRRTRHRQSLSPSINRTTSSLIKKLSFVKKKPTSYGKRIVTELQSLVTESSESDRIEYQEKLM